MESRQREKTLIVSSCRQIGKTESIRNFAAANYESLIESKHYPDIRYGFKLSSGNIGYANRIYTFHFVIMESTNFPNLQKFYSLTCRILIISFPRYTSIHSLHMVLCLGMDSSSGNYWQYLESFYYRKIDMLCHHLHGKQTSHLLQL